MSNQSNELYSSIESEASVQKLIGQANATCTSDPTLALRLASEAIEMATERGLTDKLGRALRERARAQGGLGNIDAACADFNGALECAKSACDRTLEAQCLHGLANVAYHRGDFAKALELMHVCIQIQREVGDDRGVSAALNNLGSFLADMGDFDGAISYLTETVQIARRLNERTSEAMALANIAFIKLQCHQPDDAVKYLMDSIRLAEEAGDRVTLPIILELLSQTESKLGRRDRALTAARQAIEMATAIGNRHLEATILPTLAAAEIATGQTEAGERSLLQALAIALELDAGARLPDIYRDLGKYYIYNGKLEAAGNYLERGLECAHKMNQKRSLSELHLVAVDLAEAKGDYRSALEMLRTHHRLEQELQREATHHRLIAQLAQLEVDRARKDAQLAQLEAERAQQEMEIHRLRTVELAKANWKNAVLLEQLEIKAHGLVELSVTDSLTGLYNRRYLDEYLDREVIPGAISNLLSVAIVDIDHFKQINDRFSHQSGDRVLRTVARLFTETLRKSDIVVRYGGEEFVIVLRSIGRAEAAMLCERVRSAVELYHWGEIETELAVTVSIGAADSIEISADGATSTEQAAGALLALADRRLYAAKAAGRNRVVA